MRTKQQFELFNVHNTLVTHEKNANMIFGNQGGNQIGNPTHVIDSFADLTVNDDPCIDVTEEDRLLIDQRLNLEIDNGDSSGSGLTAEQRALVPTIEKDSSTVTPNVIPPIIPTVTPTVTDDTQGKPKADRNTADATKLTKSLQFFQSRRKVVAGSTVAMASIVEFACSPNSMIGSVAENKGVESFRL